MLFIYPLYVSTTLLLGESVDRRAASGLLCLCVFCMLDIGFGDRKARSTWRLTETSRVVGWRGLGSESCPQCQVLTGEHRDIVAVLLWSGRNGGGQRELDTLSGPGASQGLGWAQWRCWQQGGGGGGDSYGSLHSVMITTMMMMMLENDPLTEARDVKLS